MIYSVSMKGSQNCLNAVYPLNPHHLGNPGSGYDNWVFQEVLITVFRVEGF